MAAMLRRPVLLVGEENVEQRRRLCAIIRMLLPCDVNEAGSGGTLLAYARVQRPDLVLLPDRLPPQGGLAILAVLHADPQTATVPVLVLTSSPQREFVANITAAGAASWLQRPYTIDDLERAVLALLRFA